MSLRGELEDMPLLDVVQIVAACEKTGSLMVSTPRGEGAIGFDRGRVVCAFSWGSLPPDARVRTLTAAGKAAYLRGRILFALSELLPSREGVFEFVLSPSAPALIGSREVSGERLDGGLSLDQLLLVLD